MKILNRAVLYLTRKKIRMLLMLLLLFLMSCFVLVGISFKKSAEKETDRLRQSLATGFILEVDMKNEKYWDNSRTYVGPEITEEMIGRILSINGVEDYSIDLSELAWVDLELRPGMWAAQEADDPETMAYLKALNAVTISEEELMVYRNETTLWPCRNGRIHKNFRTGALTIADGRNIEEGDHFKAVISEWLAENNSLSVGDTITVETKEGMFLLASEEMMKTWGEPFELEVVGIFHTNFTQSTSEYTPEYSLIENIIYTDMNTYVKLEENLESAGFDIEHRKDGYSTQYSKVEFFVEDPGKLDSIMQQIKNLENIDLENMTLMIDSSAYQAAVKPYQQIRVFAMALLAVGLCGSGIILYLVIRLWMQGRKHEIGILYSIGMKKGEILGQMLAECLIVSAAALGLAFLLSGLLTDKCVDVAESLTAPKADMAAYDVRINERYEPVITKISSDEVALDRVVSARTIGFMILFVCGISCASVILSFAKICCLEPRKLLQFMFNSSVM